MEEAAGALDSLLGGNWPPPETSSEIIFDAYVEGRMTYEVWLCANELIQPDLPVPEKTADWE